MSVSASGQGAFTLDMTISNPQSGICYDGSTVSSCTSNHGLYFHWDDADIVADPMFNHDSGSYIGMDWLHTHTAYQGYAIHSFDLPCLDTWYVWGLTQSTSTGHSFGLTMDLIDWDNPGIWDIDDSTPIPTTSSYSWTRVNNSPGSPWTWDLGPGTHALSIFGDTFDGSYPFLAYVYITNDGSFTPPDPNTLTP